MFYLPTLTTYNKGLKSPKKELINIGIKDFRKNPTAPLLLLVFTATSMITFGLGTLEFMNINIDDQANYIALMALMIGYMESGGQELMKLQGYQLGTIAATIFLLIGIEHFEPLSNMVYSDPLFTMAAFLTTVLGYAFLTMGE
ncbi:hypothetical protein [Methanonatronarchaeum sp. AMET-Sl]|uniref:hypothetical protein n=1 Tax=Methanonatronarchaeum sp. AMET-Sl TaxID=3037654 RepID=UPI00244E34B5|nr:hypothetical protein [Methanonatronarchaeum sp. AMET-Sl]WGI16952.1 hypothetical protein QEN48_05480 [Methanonatronarchaeum sp. AMET-Sl]